MRYQRDRNRGISGTRQISPAGSVTANEVTNRVGLREENVPCQLVETIRPDAGWPTDQAGVVVWPDDPLPADREPPKNAVSVGCHSEASKPRLSNRHIARLTEFYTGFMSANRAMRRRQAASYPATGSCDALTRSVQLGRPKFPIPQLHIRKNLTSE